MHLWANPHIYSRVSLAAPIGNCNYVRLVFSMYPVTIPLTTLLLVLRVCALYNNSRRAIALFSLSWLSVLASSIAVPMGVTGVQVPFTNYCFVVKSEVSWILTATGPILHDTLVFCATSWAFISHSYPRAKWRAMLGIVVRGDDLPPLSRSILRDGQAYFLWVLATIHHNVFIYIILGPSYFSTCLS